MIEISYNNDDNNNSSNNSNNNNSNNNNYYTSNHNNNPSSSSFTPKIPKPKQRSQIHPCPRLQRRGCMAAPYSSWAPPIGPGSYKPISEVENGSGRGFLWQKGLGLQRKTGSGISFWGPKKMRSLYMYIYIYIEQISWNKRPKRQVICTCFTLCFRTKYHHAKS